MPSLPQESNLWPLGSQSRCSVPLSFRRFVGKAIIDILLIVVFRIRRLSMIVRVNVVLNRTVVVDSDWRFDNLCGSHLQSQSELYHVSWWYETVVIDLIGQLHCDVIGLLSVKPRCYWLWRLVMSLVRFDPSHRTIILNLLMKWHLGSNLSQYTRCLSHGSRLQALAPVSVL